AALEDPMNADPAFLRCRIRHLMLPVLEAQTGPGAARRLARFATLAAEDDAYLQARAEEAARRLRLPEQGWDLVGLQALELPLRRRALQHLITERVGPLDGERLEAALNALATRGRCEL